MNRVYGGKAQSYKCNTCGRKVIGTSDGYLPRHRPPGKRKLCDGTGSSVRFHRKEN